MSELLDNIKKQAQIRTERRNNTPTELDIILEGLSKKTTETPITPIKKQTGFFDIVSSNVANSAFIQLPKNIKEIVNFSSRNLTNLYNKGADARESLGIPRAEIQAPQFGENTFADKLATKGDEFVQKERQNYLKERGLTKPNLSVQVAETTGNLIGFLGGGGSIRAGVKLLGKQSQKFASPIAVAYEAGAETSQVEKELEQQQIPQKEKENILNTTFLANAVLLGVSEKISPIFGGFTQLDEPVKNLKEVILGAARKANQQSFIEGTQEGLQQAISNIATGKPWDENIDDAVLIGSIFGGVAGGGINGLQLLEQYNNAVAQGAIQEDTQIEPEIDIDTQLDTIEQIANEIVTKLDDTPKSQIKSELVESGVLDAETADTFVEELANSKLLQNEEKVKEIYDNLIILKENDGVLSADEIEQTANNFNTSVKTIQAIDRLANQHLLERKEQLLLESKPIEVEKEPVKQPVKELVKEPVKEPKKEEPKKEETKKEEDDLEKEALKYDNVEDFLKGQGEVLYHGTNRIFDNFDIEKTNQERAERFGGSEGIYFTESKETASKYTKSQQNNFFGKENTIKVLKERDEDLGEIVEKLVNGEELPERLSKLFKNRDGEIDYLSLSKIAYAIDGSKSKLEYSGVSGFGGFDPNINVANSVEYILSKIGIDINKLKNPREIEVYLSKDTKIKDLGYYYDKEVQIKDDTLTITYQDRLKKHIKKAKQDGYDGVKYEHIESIDNVPEILIFNTSKIKTKQQLTDIYNEAHSNKEGEKKPVKQPVKELVKEPVKEPKKEEPKKEEPKKEEPKKEVKISKFSQRLADIKKGEEVEYQTEIQLQELSKARNFIDKNLDGILEDDGEYIENVISGQEKLPEDIQLNYFLSALREKLEIQGLDPEYQSDLYKDISSALSLSLTKSGQEVASSNLFKKSLYEKTKQELEENLVIFSGNNKDILDDTPELKKEFKQAESRKDKQEVIKKYIDKKLNKAYSKEEYAKKLDEIFNDILC